jgi:hypothetical protein
MEREKKKQEIIAQMKYHTPSPAGGAAVAVSTTQQTLHD